MRFLDLLGTSMASLRQRPFRTFMTVLGVVIGTTSVVVMVSLGVGMSQSIMQSMESNASLREVTVYSLPPDAAERGLPTTLDDEAVKLLSGYAGVANTWPIYQVEAIGKVGAATQWLSIQSVPQSMLQEVDFPFAWGEMPQQRQQGLVLGSMLATQFYNEATGEVVEVDFTHETLFLDFDTASMGGEPLPENGDDEGAPPTPPKRVIMPVVGQGEVDPANEWGINSFAVYADHDAMVETLKKAMPGKALPNQPATPDGKPKPGFVYSVIKLQTADSEGAEALLSLLREEGFDAQADIEWIRQSQTTALIVQAVFGGIGFVSLLVAAIGIANTMMMSVYERTKEIGVMKVLGAGLGDIRKIFLFESASIGFLGGLIGLVISLVGSGIVNSVAGGFISDMGMTQISVVPPWLMLGAVAFATLIGTLAGLAPAFRASRLSPLAAIRTQ